MYLYSQAPFLTTYNTWYQCLCYITPMSHMVHLESGAKYRALVPFLGNGEIQLVDGMQRQYKAEQIHESYPWKVHGTSYELEQLGI